MKNEKSGESQQWRWRRKKKMREKKVEIEPDRDWALYWSSTDKFWSSICMEGTERQTDRPGPC